MVNILGIIFICVKLSVIGIDAKENENSNQETDEFDEETDSFELDEIDAKALEILNDELKGRWQIKETYEQIRRADPDFYGFTSAYLYLSCYRQFSVSPNISVLLKLAELDLKKGTSIGELVFTCCQCCPKKEAVRSLIDLAKQGESQEKVVGRIFEFEQQEGVNCLIATFRMAAVFEHVRENAPPSVLQKFKHRWDETPAFLADIEETCIFLIRLARSANLDLDKILNHTMANGKTLFHLAAHHSEKIAKYLLKENVKINSITDDFFTPSLKVRFEKDF